MKSHSNLLAVVGVIGALACVSTQAVAASRVEVPDCKYAGQVVSVDLGTTTVAGADPHWSVSGPGASGPTHTTLGAWTALPSNWIQPSTSGAASTNFSAGDYKYWVDFYIPCEPRNYQSIAVAGAVAGDNKVVAVSINGTTLPGVACSSSTCFNTPSMGTPFTISAGQLKQGMNTLIVVIHNNETYTGMAVRATLRAMCGKECCRLLPPHPPK